MLPVREVYEAVLQGRREAVPALVRAALDRGLPPSAILDEGLIPALNEMGVRFGAHRIEIAELLLSARAMEAGLSIIEQALPREGLPRRPPLCIGTVKGDRHGIGKNIVAMRLRAAGYRVADLGVDCGAEAFLRAADGGARAVLCSALMTRSLRYLQVVADAFRDRPEIPVIIGGAPVTAELAAEIGAGYAQDAEQAVQIVGRMLPGTGEGKNRR